MEEERRKEGPSAPPSSMEDAAGEQSSTNELLRVLQAKRRRASLTAKKRSLNPFTNTTLRLTPYEYFKVAVCGLLLFLVRAVCLLLLVVVSYPFAKLALLGLSDEDLKKRPLTGWRKYPLWEMRLGCRVLLHCVGFHWVKTKGQPSQEAPIVVCNHPSIFEHFWLVYDLCPSVVAKDSLRKLPVLGTFLQALQLIFVTRESSGSRKATADAILERATAHHKSDGQDTWPQVMIFPEGTNSSTRALISFRLGAFTPGLPIQPVVVRYPYRYLDLSAGDPGLSLLWLLYRAMSQFYNRMEVRYLPVYYPSEEEKHNPKLFAHNVRQVMASALGIPTTDHAYEDVMLQGEAKKRHFPATKVLLEAASLHDTVDFVDLSKDKLVLYLNKFIEMDVDRSGEITYPEFVNVLGLPDTSYTQHLFQLLDVDESGSIDFREFITGLAMLNKNTSGDILKFAFDVLDVNKDGRIDRDELGSILRTAFSTLTEQQLNDIFDRVDVSGDGAISYDEFVSFAASNPEYIQLMLDVREEQRRDGSLHSTTDAKSPAQNSGHKPKLD